MKKILFVAALCLAATGAGAAENLSEVFTEGQVKGVVRTFYFERDYDGATTDWEDFAIGGWLHYETGSLWGLRGGVEFKTSQDLGTSDGTNTFMLLEQDGDGRDGYTGLSQYYIAGNWFNTDIKVGAQAVTTPWLKGHDIRFTPKRYRGISVKNTSIKNLVLQGYYLTDFMQWNSEEFTPFSDLTPNKTADSAAAIVGAVWRAPGPWKIQLWDYYYEDMWHSPYINVRWNPKVTEDLKLVVEARFMKQDDTGDKILGDIDTYYAATFASLAGYGAKATVQYAQVGDDTLQHRWGTHLVVLGQVDKVMYGDEKGYGLKLDYDFGYLGAKGLSAYVYYLDMNRPDSGENAGSDRNELDFQVEYKFPQPAFKGLSIKARHAILNKDTGDDANDTRIYLQYAFQLPGKKK